MIMLSFCMTDSIMSLLRNIVVLFLMRLLLLVVKTIMICIMLLLMILLLVSLLVIVFILTNNLQAASAAFLGGFIMKMYCIYDRKGELMNPPFTQANNAMALRQFQMMVNQPSSPERSNIIHDYASDFALYYLGEFDDKSCAFSAAWPTVLLANADELLTPAE